MSLYTKHRPSDLDAIVGNKATVDKLRSVLGKPREDLNRAMLFCGPSGCGKTTLARAMASALGVAEPDLREVDSADYRGIDSVRDIRQQMRLRPIAGKMRAWILDEVHQATKDAQSALLKALEDTPPHVLFLLATTDPGKLLPTIRNRCATYVVQPLSEGEIVGLLQRTCRAERRRIGEEVLDRIARDCLGSPRAALVALEAVIDLPREDQLSAVEAAVAQEGQAIEFCRALLKGAKWGAVAALLKTLQDQEPESIRRMVLGYAQSVLLGGENNRAALMLDAFASPTYDMGWPAITLSAYTVVCGGGR
jgi:DNA polymerase-3 subunit gamma/tau